MTIAVIIPAAGTGTRFGGQLPKQFHPLAGKPLIQHVIERFLLDENVTRVIVPVAEMLLGSVKNSERVVWVAGGATRQQSVIRGLAETRDAELIAVHDAARPLFSEATFHAVVAATREFGAALPVVPVTDTIHAMSEDATVRETLDRSMLAAAQTPQCFRADILRDILVRAQLEGIEGTDEAGLAADVDRALREIIAEHGWPSYSLVGEEAEDAAWAIAQHSDHDPDFQRLALRHLRAAVEAGDASPGNLAYLTDRIAVGAGEPQTYGTQIGCGEDGPTPATPIEGEARVDERRAAVGLPPLADYYAELEAICSEEEQY